MKLRRNKRFHGTLRPRIRQSWNKVNLFNLRRNFLPPKLIYRTFFQQKWIAKTLTRGYHGEHIKERKWERMFSRRLPAVVDMDPRYMARFDGSEQAAGRGSGREVAPPSAVRPDPASDKTKETEHDNASGDRFFQGQDDDGIEPWKRGTNAKTDRPTPYMQMTFAPMERRLDIAVFRAMFASSARQARQFVVHGAVTVNGKKMIYPGYLLNPGDLFQVDVERVLYATGAKKPTRPAAERAALARAAEEAQDAAEDAEDAAAAAAAAAEPSEAARRRASRELPYLAARAKYLLSDAGDELTLKKKNQLRAFIRDARRWLAKAGVDVDAADKLAAPSSASSSSSSAAASSASAAAAAPSSTSSSSPFSSSAPIAGRPVPAPESPERPNSRQRVRPPPSSKILDKLADLLADMPKPSDAAADVTAADSTAAAATAAPDKAKPRGKKAVPQLTPQERQLFEKLVTTDAENPKDPSKPYATPWRPRPFMQAFACIPRYLEVNQNICAAVYLRHPVARPGFAEVPSPYPQELTQLAFNWYLRRH